MNIFWLDLHITDNVDNIDQDSRIIEFSWSAVQCFFLTEQNYFNNFFKQQLKIEMLQMNTNNTKLVFLQ